MMNFLDGIDISRPILVTLKTKSCFGKIVPVLLRNDSLTLIIEDYKDPDRDLLWLPKTDILNITNI